MPRVEVQLPSRFDFRTELPVRIDDLNHGGHVGHDGLLAFTSEARVRLLASRGWTELDIEGVGIAIGDVAAVYRAEARYGMTLVVEVAVAAVRTRGCELYYRVTDRDTGREVAAVKMGVVFFDYRTRKVAHVPPAFRAAFAHAHEGASGGER